MGPPPDDHAPAPNHRSDLSAQSVYRTLRAIAQNHLHAERAGHTLSATALVHELYVKLQRTIALGASSPPADRAAFFRFAGDAMRKILIDHARRRGAAKRGGLGKSDGWSKAIANLDDLADRATPEEIMALDDAFVRLESEDARAAQVVRLRFYAGLSVEQAAEALGLSRRTLLRDWEFARAFLMRDLARTARRDGAPDGPASEEHAP